MKTLTKTILAMMISLFVVNSVFATSSTSRAPVNTKVELQKAG